MDRVHPRVGLSWVGSGWVEFLSYFEGRVGSGSVV